MDTIIRATVLYWTLTVVFRIIGRRAESQLSTFEMILIFFVGGMSIQSVVADDRSVVNAVCGVFAVAANHYLVSLLKARSKGFRKFIEGTPVVVLEDGQINEARLRALRMSLEDLGAAARGAGG